MPRYWQPVFIYLRTQGQPHHDAQDLAQQFFEDFLGAKDAWASRVDQGQGRFRAYLLACLRNFLRSEYTRRRALKRGGEVQVVPLETLLPTEQLPAVHPSGLDLRYDRAWAVALTDAALKQLAGEFIAHQRGHVFNAINPTSPRKRNRRRKTRRQPSGAMGITYMARDPNRHCEVALKVINQRYLSDPAARQRFLREARAAAGLRHPNIAGIFHLGCRGDDADIAAQVALALAAAHRKGFLHQDINPANLMLVTSETGLPELPVLKVIEFGLVKNITGSGAVTDASFPGDYFIGTPPTPVRNSLHTGLTTHGRICTPSPRGFFICPPARHLTRRIGCSIHPGNCRPPWKHCCSPCFNSTGNPMLYGGTRYASALGYLRQQQGDHGEGTRLLRRTADMDLSADLDGPQNLYDLAATRTARGSTAEGLELLQKACEAGWLDVRWLKLDPRFDALHSSEDFWRVVTGVETKIAAMRRIVEQWETIPVQLADDPAEPAPNER